MYMYAYICIELKVAGTFRSRFVCFASAWRFGPAMWRFGPAMWRFMPAMWRFRPAMWKV